MNKLYSYEDVRKAGYILKDSAEETSVKFDFALSNYGTISNNVLTVGSDRFPLVQHEYTPVTEDSDLAKHLSNIKPGAYKEKQPMRGNPFFDSLVGGMWYDKFH